jgi:hypothetical protein
MERDKIVELIRKVRRLAESGVAGERTSAETKIRILCKKYNIQEHEFADTENATPRYFLYKTEIEREILSNVICMILQAPTFTCGENNQVLRIKLLQKDYENVVSAYEYYRDMFNFYSRHLVRGMLSRNMVGYIPPASTSPAIETPADAPPTPQESVKSDIDQLLVIKFAVAIEKLPWESIDDKNLQVCDKLDTMSENTHAPTPGKDSEITGSSTSSDREAPAR